MFVDEVVLKLVAGKGGDGCTSFRREKYVEFGGPNGGNGGRGSNIIFKTDKSLRTLIDLKMKKLIKGNKGTNGSGSDKNGANAEDIIIKVPMGTVVTNANTNELIVDLISEEQEEIIANGGRGGRGNKAFATNENKAPTMSELGQPGEEIEIKCELKMLADVGLIGLPNVGKSTILSMVSNAKPKVASYHFTTLTPNLGVVKIYNDEFVIADLPGLIEGASSGAGLGFQFLRHASRTKVLMHVIDMSASEGRDPIEDYQLILNEIKNYDQEMLSKESVVVANKMDIDGAEENFKIFQKKYPDTKIFKISAIMNKGFEELLKHLNILVKSKVINDESKVQEKIYKYKKEEPFKISKKENQFIITGKKIEDLVSMTRFDDNESLNRFIRVTKAMGIDDALIEAGAEIGDEVKILDKIFNFKH